MALGLTIGIAEADRLYAQGMEAYKEERYNEAIEAFSSAYALTPPSKEAARSGLSKNIAIVWRKLGNLTQAVNYYRQALADWPTRDQASAQLIADYITSAEKELLISTKSKWLRFGVALIAMGSPLLAMVVARARTH